MKLATKLILRSPIASCKVPARRASKRAKETYSSVPGSASAETPAKVSSAMSTGGPTGM